MKNENWKDILGYEGLYQVSDLGRVRSLDREVVYSNGKVRIFKGKLLKPHIEKDGRVSIQLSKNGNRKTTKVCRLVALTFIGEKPEGYHVCHNDGNARNNTLMNIRYDIPTENSIDFYRYGSKTANGILTIEQVLEIRKLYKTGICSLKELVERFPVSKSAILSIVNRKSFQWLNDDGTIEESNTAVS